MARLELNSHTLRDRNLSGAAPIVLLLHGFFGQAHNWRQCAEALSRHARVLVPQLPFFGLRRGESSLDRVNRFLDELIRHEDAQRLLVIGNSLGGQIGVNLALREPDRVAGLVLTGSSGLYERHLTVKIHHRPEREQVRERIKDIFFDPLMITEEMVDETYAMVNDRRKAREVVVLARRIRETNISSLLPQVQCPVQLIWGADDRITPSSTALDFKRLLPNAELHFLPNCGHAAMMERPAEFNHLVENFLFRLAGENGGSRRIAAEPHPARVTI